MSEVVRIYNPTGTVSDYELLASRLPKFLEQYGPDKGYRVVIQTKPLMEIKPGMLRLYEAAIAAGKMPSEVGLPPVGEGMIFKALLLDKDGNTVLTASSLCKINEYKDWEIGETAARQRLVAAAGYNGTLIENDEKGDLNKQEKASEPVKPTRRGSRGKGNKKEPKASAGNGSVTQLPSAQSSANTDGVPPAMLRQIEHLAKVKGMDVKTPTTMEEAKAQMKSLLS